MKPKILMFYHFIELKFSLKRLKGLTFSKKQGLPCVDSVKKFLSPEGATFNDMLSYTCNVFCIIALWQFALTFRKSNIRLTFKILSLNVRLKNKSIIIQFHQSLKESLFWQEIIF